MRAINKGMANIYSVLGDSGPESIYVFNDVTAAPLRTKFITPPAAVFYAAKKGSIKPVLRALKEGMSPNVTFNGNTLLNYAIYYDRVEIVKLLIQHGADPTQRSDAYKMDAFEEANSKPDIKILLQK